eukprot:12426917-Karenia_brevis.AAC.1
MSTHDTQVSKKLRKMQNENSMLHLVPHGKPVQNIGAWDLSLIALAMDEARAEISRRAQSDRK